MRNDSAQIFSVPVPILIETRFSFFNLLRSTLRAWITNPRDRVYIKTYPDFYIPSIMEENQKHIK